MFVQDAHLVHYGVLHQINVSMYAGKIQHIPHQLQHVSVSLAMVLKMEFVNNAQSTISFLMDSVLHAQLIQAITLHQKIVNAFLDITQIKMVFASKNAELMKFMILLLKIVFV